MDSSDIGFLICLLLWVLAVFLHGFSIGISVGESNANKERENKRETDDDKTLPPTAPA